MVYSIAREYHKSYPFIIFTCNPQWPQITNSPLPNKQPQDGPDSKFYLLSKLYDKSFMLAEPLLFLTRIDAGMLHLLHQHHLLLVLLVAKALNGSKTSNLYTMSM